MSLINDALKRAREAQRKDAPPEVSPLRPVETHQKERDLSRVLPVVIVFLIVTACVLIGLALARHGANGTTPKMAVAPAIVFTQKVVTVAAPVSNPPAPALPVSVSATSAPPVASPAVTNTPVSKPLRIQGIAYDAAHPSAIIGGKAVYVGDLVDGMRVTAITSNSVTLAGNGQTKTLVVGQP